MNEPKKAQLCSSDLNRPGSGDSSHGYWGRIQALAPPPAWKRTDTLRLIALLALALVARLGLLIAHWDRPDWFLQPDSGIYIGLAENLAESFGYGPHLIRPPGYPLLLAIWIKLGGSASPGWLALVSLFCGLGVVAVVYLLARRILRQRNATLVTALVAFFPNQIFYSVQVLTEIPFTLGLVLALLFLLRYLQTSRSLDLLVAGAFTAMAQLIKPLAGPLALLFAVALLAVGPRMRLPRRHVLLYLLLPVIAYAGWSARNAAATGRFLYSSSGRFNLLFVTAAKAKARTEGISLQESQQRLTREIEQVVGRSHRGLYDDVEFIDRYPAVSAKTLLENIGGLPSVWTFSLAEFAAGTATGKLIDLSRLSTGANNGDPLRRPGDLAILQFIRQRLANLRGTLGAGKLTEILLLLVVIMASAWAAIRIALRQPSIPGWLLILTAAYFTIAINLMGMGYARMRLPIEPLLFILAATVIERHRKATASPKEKDS